jgi:hypothetical protein
MMADRIWRLGSDDRGLGQAEVASRPNSLLRVTDSRALHRPFHRTRAAARADVEPLEPECVADDLGVVVLLTLDRVPAPADDETRLLVGAQHTCVAQDVEHGVRDSVRAREIETRIVHHVIVRIEKIAQHREQVLADTADHLGTDERDVGRVLELERDAALVLHDGDPEVLVPAQDFANVVIGGAGVEYGERALSPKLVEPALARIAKLTGLDPRENLEAALRGDQGVHEVAARSLDYGRISIGVDSRVMSQMSTISELLTAMQPSVQSVV